MNVRDIKVFGLGAVVTGSVVGALYYWSTRNQPVSVSDETHDEEVNTEEESQRPLNPDSDDLEPDSGNCDVPPSYEEQPPSYSSNVYTDAEPTDQDNQQPPSHFEYDAVILHASHDEEEVKKCKEVLERCAMSGNVKAVVGFIDDVIRPGSNIIEGLCELLLKCRLVLVFHTKNFKKDGLTKYAKDINLNQAIHDTDKNTRIIPLLVDDEVLSEDLSIFAPVSYHDENSLKKMSELFTYWRNKLP